MKKLTSIAVAILLSATLTTGIAFAHDGGNGGNEGKGSSHGFKNFGQVRSAFAHSFNQLRLEFKHNHNRGDKDKDNNDNDQNNEDRIIFGGAVKVTALSGGDEITAEGLRDSDKEFTLNTDSNTDFFLRNGNDADFNDVTVGDTIVFTGTITDRDGDDYTVDASKVRIFGDVDFTAKAKVTGEITDVDSGDDQLTIETDNNGTITVNTDTFTTIKDEDGEEIDLDDLSVGMDVRIKGFWNSLMNAITAIKVKITG